MFCSCGLAGVVLCDWKVSSRASGTCDRPLCKEHSTKVGGMKQKHLCPEHHRAWQLWQKRHPPAQGSLDFQEMT